MWSHVMSKVIYRVTLVFEYLGLVDLDLACSTTLLGQKVATIEGNGLIETCGDKGYENATPPFPRLNLYTNFTNLSKDTNFEEILPPPLTDF